MRKTSERVESPGAQVTELVSRDHFCWPCVLLDRPPMLWWLTPGEELDAVVINCVKGATTEYQGADAKYMG